MIGLTSGGTSEAELRDADVVEARRDVQTLLKGLDPSAMGQLISRSRRP
ncbi:hypothetical protein [Arthrobacter sp. H35-D1]|nr:hypothetical protein [Arthrobacter sp. H35-D1]MDJ0315424.1 hypothetical protein [Arthrobacter sp. H35-D1]